MQEEENTICIYCYMMPENLNSEVREDGNCSATAC
jgi:hypothetical protein